LSIHRRKAAALRKNQKPHKNYAAAQKPHSRRKPAGSFPAGFGTPHRIYCRAFAKKYLSAAHFPLQTPVNPPGKNMQSRRYFPAGFAMSMFLLF